MEATGLAFLSAGIGMGIAALGTGMAIGLLTGKALESMARQPESANVIRTSMIIAIAFVEAIALYSLVINLILVTKG